MTSDTTTIGAGTPSPSTPLLAALRTLERSFRQRAAHRESEYRRTGNHGAHLIGVHVGMCADDLRDLLKRHTANAAGQVAAKQYPAPACSPIQSGGGK